MTLTFFRTPEAFRKWLEEHHATKTELWVGYYKKETKKASITWPESVDQALCHGWIDGIRKSVDESSYMIRFTPRRRGSTWSSVNIRRAGTLIEAGLMQPAGLTAYEARTEYKSGIYSYEQRSAELPEPYRGLFKRDKAAWSFFESQRPSYRKLICWWIVSAKKEETRLTRLKRVMQCSALAQTLPEATPRKASTTPKSRTRS